MSYNWLILFINNSFHVCLSKLLAFFFFFFPPQCFKIFASNITRKLVWHDARDICINLGGNLATVPNEQVQGTYTSFTETCYLSKKNIHLLLRKILYFPKYISKLIAENVLLARSVYPWF